MTNVRSPVGMALFFFMLGVMLGVMVGMGALGFIEMFTR